MQTEITLADVMGVLRSVEQERSRKMRNRVQAEGWEIEDGKIESAFQAWWKENDYDTDFASEEWLARVAWYKATEEAKR